MTNIRSRYQPQIQAPPSTFTGDEGIWMRRAYDLFNMAPPVSVFSLPNPNSMLTAERSTVGINLSSVTSVLWVKQVGSSNTGWVPIA